MPEKECLKSENCVYFYLTTAFFPDFLAVASEQSGTPVGREN